MLRTTRLASNLIHHNVMTSSCRKLSMTSSCWRKEKLFTPGPLSVSDRVRAAMTRDVGTRHHEFMQLIKYIQASLLELASADNGNYVCVPMQGSGTSAVESTIMTSLKNKNGKILVIENGSYGKRLAHLSQQTGTNTKVLSFAEGDVINIDDVIRNMDDDVTAVTCTHCETSTGVINPVHTIGEVVKRKNKNVTFFVDAMSSFGGIPFDMNNIDYMVSSANKCIQGVPGFSYVIADRRHLNKCEGVCTSVTLDLYAQMINLEKSGQFRFTAPTHVMLAFGEALRELQDEGGVNERFKRYKNNSELLHRGMKEIGFRTFIDPQQHPLSCIITSFHFPDDVTFDFQQFYQRLSELGDVIYPGQVTSAKCFRIGTIGDIHHDDVTRLLDNIKQVTKEMNIKF